MTPFSFYTPICHLVKSQLEWFMFPKAHKINDFLNEIGGLNKLGRKNSDR